MSRFRVERAEWCEAAAAALETALHDDGPLASLGWLEAEIRRGRTKLYRAEGPAGGAYFALRIDVMEGWLEAVIVAAAGRAEGASLIRDVYPMIEEIARRAGAKSVRFHSERFKFGPVMARWFGFAEAERIYRRVLA